MMRPSPEKRSKRRALADDVEAFLQQGGEIQELEGFGCQPTIDQAKLPIHYNRQQYKSRLAGEKT